MLQCATSPRGFSGAGFDLVETCRDPLSPRSLNEAPVVGIRNGQVKTMALPGVSAEPTSSAAERLVAFVRKRSFGEFASPDSEASRDESDSEARPAKLVCADFARESSMLRVPAGVAGGDRIRLFDIVTFSKSADCIEVPLTAYEGQQLGHEAPPRGVALLLGDGSGWTVGGKPISQHAARLEVHKKKCKDCDCRVLGCGVKKCCELFADPEPEKMNDYRVWQDTQRRINMRKHVVSISKQINDSQWQV